MVVAIAGATPHFYMAPAMTPLMVTMAAMPRQPGDKQIGPSVSKLIQVEFYRLADRLRGQKPQQAAQMLNYWAESRGPLIHWAFRRHVLGEKPGEPAGHWHPSLRAATPCPTVLDALNSLRKPIMMQLRASWKTSPWSTCRLAYSALLVSVAAVLSNRIPACAPLVQRFLAPLLAQAATALERNHQRYSDAMAMYGNAARNGRTAWKLLAPAAFPAAFARKGLKPHSWLPEKSDIQARRLRNAADDFCIEKAVPDERPPRLRISWLKRS